LPKPILVSPKVLPPSPTPTLVNNKIQVSGTVDYRGLEIQPTQIQFTNTATNLTYTAIVQNGSYNVSLPNQQIYSVVGTWGKLTFNATGILISGINMGTLNLNAGVGVTSMTQNLPTPSPSPPIFTSPSSTPIITSTPSPSNALPTSLNTLHIIIGVVIAIVIIATVVFLMFQKKLKTKPEKEAKK